MEPHIGNLKLGELPRVVGSVYTRDQFNTLAAKPDAVCDIVEVRLDTIGTELPDWPETCRAIESAGYPVILTIRSAGEGGEWKGEESARQKLYQQGLKSVSAIDIELHSDLAGRLAAQAKTLGKAVLLSFHDFEKTPAPSELNKIIREGAAHDSPILKLATLIQSEEDIQNLRHLLHQAERGRLCVLGMGPMGLSTRWEFPALGSCLTYGYVDRLGAPGQPACAELVERLEKTIPQYRRATAKKK